MYYVVYALFYLLSLLPFWLMYGISSVISFLLCHVFRYRRAVVYKNLLIAFPDKSDAERKQISRSFYTHFTDNWIEFIKMISISKTQLNKRFTSNYSAMNNWYESGRNIQVHLGHCFNWEMGNMAFGLHCTYPFVGVYKPITSKVIDRIFYKVRTRFGSKLVSAYKFNQEFKPYIRNRFVLALIADQKEFPGRALWAPFFGQMATFVQGAERTARLTNAIVMMVDIKRVKRGYYHAQVHLLTSEPRTLPFGSITHSMISFLEDNIRQQPPNYLWSHNRWKYTYDASKHIAI